MPLIGDRPYAERFDRTLQKVLSHPDLAPQMGSVEPHPKNILRLFFRNSLTRLKITLEVKNNLLNLVLKCLFEHF